MTERAAILRAVDEPLRIEEITLAPLAPDQVRVRIAASGVCHSDLHIQAGGHHRSDKRPKIAGQRCVWLQPTDGARGYNQSCIAIERFQRLFIPKCAHCIHSIGRIRFVICLAQVILRCA